MRLTEAERAELAQSLIASLDGPADPDAEAAWDAEIVRRVEEIDDGTAKLIDRDELRRRVQGRLRRI
jgi:putative addiction module component (TIGR02574 family)